MVRQLAVIPDVMNLDPTEPEAIAADTGADR
jgi:hypothetical protein